MSLSGLRDNGTVALTNTNIGTISSTSPLIGIGVFANTAATVTNYGTISGTSTGGPPFVDVDGLPFAHLGIGIEATTATITNYGTIAGIGTGISAIGIGITATSATVTNYGAISGTGTGIDTLGAGSNVTNNGTISGNTFAIHFGGGDNTLTLGPTAIVNGTVIAGGTNNAFQLGGPGHSNFDLSTIGASGQYKGFDTFNLVGGTWTVFNTFGQSQTWNVDGGTLAGTGTLSSINVNKGGTLSPGTGPGTAMTITGNLAFQSGAIYLVQLNPSTSSFANVTGTAALSGATVNAVFAGGNYVSKQYTILTASGGVSGTFALNIVNTNLPANFHTALSYDANDAFLNLSLTFGIPGNLNGNQQAVGNAITNFFNTTGGIPMVYAALTPAQLTQASGELGTASQQTTYDAMGQFMGLLTDPFMNRTGGANVAPGTTGYADKGLGYAASKRDAYAMDTKAIYTKAPPVPFVPRWSVWAAGYGGSQSTSGNAFVGSNDTTSRIAGTAVGADYLFSPTTLAGFAIAGGGTSFSVNNLGSGRSDLFQAGAYVRHTNGPAYITAALAYGWQDVTTNRMVSIFGIDQLRAEFNANAYSGRVEGGHRFVAPVIGGIGITPYAAGQFTTFDLPNYMEQAIVGSNQFALAYNAKSMTDTRSELGVRTDKSFAMANGIFTMRGRLAWAHDYDPDRNVLATFQTLPGASFVVNGATHAADSALTTASAEWKWVNGWSTAATFEGEFSNVTRSYAGKGVVRYQW
ncbi:autotransporter domain-containing protein [Bradyrhizobium jicamae]|nr:autotransporter domain-containing protein [Bradyrhizobium jicamae]